MIIDIELQNHKYSWMYRIIGIVCFTSSAKTKSLFDELTNGSNNWRFPVVV